MKPVVFIGAGPGVADLITVRGAQRLAAAELVLFDALSDPALRVLAQDLGPTALALAAAVTIVAVVSGRVGADLSLR